MWLHLLTFLGVFLCEDEVDHNFRDLCGRYLTHQNTPWGGGVVVSNSAPDQWKVIFVFSLSPKVGFKRLYGATLESPVLTHKTQN